MRSFVVQLYETAAIWRRAVAPARTRKCFIGFPASMSGSSQQSHPRHVWNAQEYKKGHIQPAQARPYRFICLRPGDSLAILNGFVNRLQDSRFSVSFLPAIQATGLEPLPRWDFRPLFMPAFAGRTLLGTSPAVKADRLPVRRETWGYASRLQSLCARPVESISFIIK